MNIIKIFEDCVSRYGSNPLIMEKQGHEYLSLSYHDIFNRVKRFSIGLLSLGVKPGDSVALYADCGTDWLVSELSILSNQAVFVPLPSLMREEIDLKFCLQHAQCKCVIVSKTQFEIIKKIKDYLPLLNLVILLDEYWEDDFDVISKERVYALGRELYDTKNEELNHRILSIKYDDVAMIYYTNVRSQLTGVLYTHKSLIVNVEQITSLLQIGEWKRFYMLLPWSDIFVHQLSLLLVLYNGSVIVVPQVNEDCFCHTFFRDLHVIRPNVVFCSLSSIKVIKLRIEEELKRQGEIFYSIFQRYIHHIKLSTYRSKLFWNYKSPHFFSFWTKFVEHFICETIRTALGGDLEYILLRGHFLDKETELFFLAIGIPILRGFGTVESCSFVSINFIMKDYYKLGSVGKSFHSIDLKIGNGVAISDSLAEVGEICVKTDGLMLSYKKDEILFKQTVKNGWLNTGWLGTIDSDGFLYIEGEISSLQTNSLGENFSPEKIENSFYLRSPYVSQCYLSNNGMDYPVMLVVPNRTALLSAINPSMRAEQKVREAIRILYDSLRKIGLALQREFPQRWIPSLFFIVGENLMPCKRGVFYCEEYDRTLVERHYGKEIKAAYQIHAKNPYNPVNLRNMNKVIGYRN